MAENSFRDVVNKLREIFDRFHQNHHEIENEFNSKLKRSLSRSELNDLTSEECSSLIEAVDKALDVVDSESHILCAVKDSLKQAKIDTLEVKLKYCKCQDVPLRKEHKRSNNNNEKTTDTEHGKSCVNSGTSNISSTDSRVMSEPGDIPVVQPSDTHANDEVSGSNTN